MLQSSRQCFHQVPARLTFYFIFFYFELSRLMSKKLVDESDRKIEYYGCLSASLIYLHVHENFFNAPIKSLLTISEAY